MRLTLISVLAATMLPACAFMPHKVAVTAQAPKAQSSEGEGVALFLEVIDDRDSTVVGQRGIGRQGANITAAQILPTLERELKAGFEVKGFQVLSSKSGADAEVEARLRAFKYFIQLGFFTVAENTSVVVAIEADKAGDDYDRTYRASGEQPGRLYVPGGSSIDENLNAGLSYVLSEIMSDRKLMEFLVAKPPAS